MNHDCLGAACLVAYPSGLLGTPHAVFSAQRPAMRWKLEKKRRRRKREGEDPFKKSSNQLLGG